MKPDLKHEADCPAPVCGVDEAGRGPWAGPVVAAAVVLDPAAVPEGLNDSKLLRPARRVELADQIRAVAQWGVGEASVTEIDAMGVGKATWLAMRRAIDALPQPPAFALIDGRGVPTDLPCQAAPLVKGDRKSASIAAASILAKTHRDAIMVALSQQFEGYGWHKNMGYGVPEHISGLRRHGVTLHHRKSFRPIHNILCEENLLKD